MVIVSQKINVSFYNVQQHLKGQSYSTLLSRTMGSFFSWDNAGPVPYWALQVSSKASVWMPHSPGSRHTYMQAGRHGP